MADCDGPAFRTEHIDFLRLPALPGVEVMTASHSPRLWRVFHETYSIAVIPRTWVGPSNRSDWRYRGRDNTFEPGVIGIMEPGELHVTKQLYRPSVSFWVMHVRPSLLSATAVELGLPSRPHFATAQSSDRVLQEVFDRFYTALAGEASALELDIRLSACLRLILESCGERRPESPCRRSPAPLDGAREYIHDHFREPIRLETLATVARISRFHLARAFTRAYGLPPHAYQNTLRVAAARVALQAGVPISEVDVGFADQSHLTRWFKRSLGITPGRYSAAAPHTSAPAIGRENA